MTTLFEKSTTPMANSIVRPESVFGALCSGRDAQPWRVFYARDFATAYLRHLHHRDAG